MSKNKVFTEIVRQLVREITGDDHLSYGAKQKIGRVVRTHTETVESAKLEGVRIFITDGWGKRCKIKDTDEYPEMIDDPMWTRCAGCKMWENYDEWVQELTPNLPLTYLRRRLYNEMSTMHQG